ncbi:site-specific integrase [Bacillus subtilis]|uniref:site-specific integrase n=1 Tax=Bacillus subtilis TaxID=1423 RepID=UPI003978F721
MNWTDENLNEQPETLFYASLKNFYDSNLLLMMRGNETFLLDEFTEECLRIFERIKERSWANHLLLIVLLKVRKNLSPSTYVGMTYCLNSRIKDFYNLYDLKSINELDLNKHVYPYLKRQVFKDHTDSQRLHFLHLYISGVNDVAKWFNTLNEEKKKLFENFLLPSCIFEVSDFPYMKQTIELSQMNRKEETDAVEEFLPAIRAESQFRWQCLKRIREAYKQALEKAKGDFPFEFSYEEPERVGFRLYFRVWDKKSFVLKQQEKFPQRTIRNMRSLSSDKDYTFLEYLKSERIDPSCNEKKDDGLWFLELIKNKILGFSKMKDIELLKKKDSLLRSWGYTKGLLNDKGVITAFNPNHSGLLSLTEFLQLHQNKAEGILFQIESLYSAAIFGLLAVTMYTTNGARLNELLQINNTKECLRFTQHNGRIIYSFFAVPKGRFDLQEFIITKDIINILNEIKMMLKEHYQSEKIPAVKYSYGLRAHLFKEPKPYYFQYNYRSLNGHGLTTCMMFLLHGMNFRTREGRKVIIKSHLLRHAFATEAVTRFKVPHEVLANVLHQKNIAITKYYSKPTTSQVLDEITRYQNLSASFINMDERRKHIPELDQILEEHEEHIGIYNKVAGGVCVTNDKCPVNMQCVGCKAKIPEPNHKDELEEVLSLANDMEKRFRKMGLTIEVKKSKKMRNDAEKELKQIKFVDQYRKEIEYVPKIKSW